MPMPGWAVILLMFALVAAALGAARLLGRTGERAETASARVVSKRSGTRERGRLYKTPATVYFAVFRLEDGRELELSLEGADFAELREGAEGALTWRGREFLRFREEG